MKKFLIYLSTIAILIFGLSIPISAATAISVEVNGKLVDFPDAKPFIDSNNRILIPLRPIADAMGMSVEWDAKNQKASFKKTYSEDNSRLYYDETGNGDVTYFVGQDEIIFTVGSSVASRIGTWSPMSGTAGNPLSDGIIEAIIEDTVMDTTAVIIDGRIYAPIRFLVEGARGTVSWDGAARKVVIVDRYPATAP